MQIDDYDSELQRILSYLYLLPRISKEINDHTDQIKSSEIVYKFERHSAHYC